MSTPGHEPTTRVEDALRAAVERATGRPIPPIEFRRKTECGTCPHAAEGHRASDGVCEVRYVDGARCYCPGFRTRIAVDFGICNCGAGHSIDAHSPTGHAVTCPVRPDAYDELWLVDLDDENHPDSP